jgi:phage terminase large subunit-like protein
VVRKDAAGNIKLDQEKSRRKIDGMAALVNAEGAAIAHPEEPRPVYEERGMLWL